MVIVHLKKVFALAQIRTSVLIDIVRCYIIQALNPVHTGVGLGCFFHLFCHPQLEKWINIYKKINKKITGAGIRTRDLDLKIQNALNHTAMAPLLNNYSRLRE